MAAQKKQKRKMFTEADARAWFMNLSHKDFVEICEAWNNNNLKIRLPRGYKDFEYDDWVNYFKKLNPRINKILSTSGIDILPTDGYTALMLWGDIIKSPHRINKIHQAQLTNAKDKDADTLTITELAENNDQMGVLKALRHNIAQKLEKGVATRDLSSLSKQLVEITDQIKRLERKSGARKNTKLADLIDGVPAKTPRKGGRGARSGSIRARITIDDLEA